MAKNRATVSTTVLVSSGRRAKSATIGSTGSVCRSRTMTIKRSMNATLNAGAHARRRMRQRLHSLLLVEFDDDDEVCLQLDDVAEFHDRLVTDDR
jgi:hypothetical protein